MLETTKKQKGDSQTHQESQDIWEKSNWENRTNGENRKLKNITIFKDIQEIAYQ